MKRLKYLLLASLVAFAACDEENTTDLQTGSVNVTVSAGGSPLSGVTVSLGAAGTQPVVTGTDGVANFATVPVGTYTVTVTGLTADVVCSSTTQPVTVAAGQTTAVTFACNIVQTASISGTVAFSNGDPRPNASVTITRTAPAGGTAVTLTTDATGRYSLTGLRSGTYTVSLAVTANCTTAASTQTLTLAAGEARVANFTCTVAAPTEPATVAIQSITAAPVLPTDHPDLAVNCPAAGTSLEPSQLSCRVNVTVGIEEGQQTVSKLELLLGSQVVYTQSFGAAAVSEEMQLATFNVTATINTAAFNATTGVPSFLNGAINLVARIFTTQSPATPVHAATLAAQILNEDLVFLTVTLPRTAIGIQSPTTGLLWEGGSLTATGVPVMYSGKTVTRMVFTVNCPALGDSGSATDTSAPYTQEFPDDDDCDDDGVDDVQDPAVTVSATTVLSDNQPGPDFTTGERRVDNVPPTISQLDQALRFNRSYPVTGWVGRNHTFTVTTGTQSYRVRAVDGGVGRTGSFFTYMAGMATDAMATVTAPTSLAESLTRNEYFLNLAVKDLLENSITRWHDGTSAGVSGSSSNLAALPGNPNARFGVDLVDPEIDVVDGSLENMQIIENAGGIVHGTFVQVNATDERSGFPVNPIHTRITREAPGVEDEDACALAFEDDGDCLILGGGEYTSTAGGTNGSFDFVSGTYTFGGLTDAYYRVEYRAMDAGGNVSPWIDLRVIRDTEFPAVGAPSVPASLAGNQQVSFSAGAEDNLDLNRADGFLVFSGATAAFRQSTSSLGTWGPPFTESGTATSAYSFVASIQMGSAAAPTAATNHLFRVYDHALNVTNAMSAAFGVVTPAPRDFNAGAATVAIAEASETLESTEADLCWGTACGTEPTSTTLRFSVQGVGSQSGLGGPIANPFVRVVFYVGIDENQDGVVDAAGGNALWTSVATDTGATISENPDASVRTLLWQVNATAAQLGPLAGHIEADGTAVMITAVGYAADGTAFAFGTPVSVTLSPEP